MMEASKDSTENRFLQFSLGKENYAIPLLGVREVVGVPETTPIPYTPPYFVGMMNLRGQVISVIDLRKKMNITPKANNPESAVVIVDLNPVYLGLLVDSVNRVVALEGEQLQPAPDMEGGKRLDYMTGVFRMDEQLTAVIDVRKLLNLEDLKSIGSKKAA
jgi:purine-binding chemotaxis protein CheW